VELSEHLSRHLDVGHRLEFVGPHALRQGRRDRYRRARVAQERGWSMFVNYVNGIRHAQLLPPTCRVRAPPTSFTNGKEVHGTWSRGSSMSDVIPVTRLRVAR